MDYGLNIVASVKGQSRLDATLRTIGQIRNLAKDIKPIDLGTKRAGKLNDEIRKAKLELDNFARGVTNAMQKGDKTTSLFSSTLAGATGQAKAFGVALDNINFNKNATEAKNYANALAQAEAKAEGLAATQNELVRNARQQAGVAIGPATQLGTPDALAQQVSFESSQITKANKLRQEQASLVERINTLASKNVQVGQLNSQVARINLALDERRVDAAEEMAEELRDQIRQNEKIINQNKKKKKDADEETKSTRKRNVLADAAQGAILGGGFPLLFGGPSFAALGGLLGGGASGAAFGQKASFAGGIGGSVIGTVFDNMIKAALELGEALENPTKNIQALTKALPISGTKTKSLIDQLNDVGLSSVASSLALKTLDKELENFGLEKEGLKNFKEQTDEFSNAFTRLKIAAAVTGGNKLIKFLNILTSFIGFLDENAKAKANLMDAALSDLGLGASSGKNTNGSTGPTISAGPLAQKSNPPKPPATAEEVRAAALLANFREREIKLAKDAALIEQSLLQLVRGRLAEAKAIVDIDRAQIAFDQASLNFESESNEVQKEVLRTKKEVAKFALIEAQAARENAATLRKQADAAFELERSTKSQALILKQINAETSAKQAIRATSPFENETFLLDPVFGNSRKLQSEQTLQYTEALNSMNKELDMVYKNFEFGIDLSKQEKLALVDKAVELENQIALYKEYQPAINEAALAQARFNDALAFTSPVVDSLFNNLQQVVAGTKSAKEAFADFLMTVADLLMETATQMIATYIAIGIARAFAGMGGGEASSSDIQVMGASPTQANTIARGGSVGWSTDMGPNGGVLNPKSFSFAQGGFVSSPTNALIGEGGEPEYVIPESKMRESMSRYSNGSRGNSVIPANGGGGGEMQGSGGGVAVAAPIDVRFSVERINNVDYVTADQFQNGMRSAAEQGAKRGEQNTLKRLQMSGGTRKRLGL